MAAALPTMAMSLGPRAFWDSVPTRVTTTASASPAVSCLPEVTLSANGTVNFFNDINGISNVTLENDAIFTPYCENDYDLGLTIAAETEPEIADEGLRETFVTSTLPVIYALAATTVVGYMLVIMLFITPRTYVSGGTVVLGSRGFSGTSSAEAGIGIGGRPWLQKVAALSVAISLTIATANTFDIAAAQYEEGFMDSKALQEKVLGGQELKIIMTVSDAFLWLAQAQTLIRLFPRHREKVIIKWTALALISLCLLFNILNDFYYHGSHKARHFVDAVPALSYLFQLALGLLYCAWVMYYGVTKKKSAFYHPRMRNMCLLALLSIVAILVPVVFFVVDISKPEIARWGDYVRWVGACAASVVVWEWVERIEALERDDKRDGVLGREVFDGDEMLENTPSTVVTEKHSDHDSKGGKSSGTGFWPGSGGRHRARNQDGRKRRRRNTDDGGPPQTPHVPSVPLPVPQWPTRPTPVATPISRTNTASAESTIYAVRYHPIGEASETIPEHTSSRSHPRAASRASTLSRRSSFDIDVEAQAGRDFLSAQTGDSPSSSMRKQTNYSDETTAPAAPTATTRLWSAFTSLNPFSKARQRPPPEVSAHVARTRPTMSRQTTKVSVSSKTWDILGKVEDFATEKAEMFRKKPKESTLALPVTRIPAPRRAIEEYAEEVEAKLEEARRRQRQRNSAGSSSPRSPGLPTEVDISEQRDSPREVRRPSLIQSHTEPLVRRGDLAFAPVRQEEWGALEHDAIGTSSSEGQQATSAPTTSAGPPTASGAVQPSFQNSWYTPLGPDGFPLQRPDPEPPISNGSSESAPPPSASGPITPGTENLPVVRIPPPPLRGQPGDSSALRTRPEQTPAPTGPVIPDENTHYRY